MKLSVPLSWKQAEGERPHIVQKWTSNAGYGTDVFVLLIEKLPTGLSDADKQQILSESNAKSIVGANGNVIDFKLSKVETLPVAIVNYSQQIERLDLSAKIRGVSYLIIVDNALVTIQMMCMGADKSQSAEDRYDELETLVKAIANSLVIPSVYR